MLQFFLGSSGTGKSAALYDLIIKESIRHPEKKYLVIVPEQFTLQTQKELVTMHPAKGIMNIDVLSFLRLAFRVFSEVGMKSLMILEDMGKGLIVKRILMENREQLCQYAPNIRRKGFIEEMKSIISELYQYDITTERMAAMKEACKNQPMLYRKLSDIETCYLKFQEYLQDKYITAEEILTILSREARKSRMFDHTVIAMDGFTGFTPSQYQLLQTLLSLAENVYLTVTIDRTECFRVQREHQLFYLSYRTKEKLTELAGKSGCEVAEPRLFPEIESTRPIRFAKSEELAALEFALFRHNGYRYEKDCGDIFVTSERNPQQEVAYCVVSVRRLVREEGMRYRDIAVITGDMQCYGELLQNSFEAANIPCFIDDKKSILSNPLCELIRSLIGLAEENYSFESVFRYMKCALSEFSDRETDEAENYCLAAGIHGSHMWENEWDFIYKTSYPLSLETLNGLRERFISFVAPVISVLRDTKSTVGDCVDCLTDYLEVHEIEKRIDEMAELWKKSSETPQSGRYRSATFIKEYEQIFRLTTDILTRAKGLLGTEVIMLREFREIMETGFMEAKVGLIPPGLDQILVGDMERTRLKGIKALFFLGVNEGVVPKRNTGGGILNDSDRMVLAECGVELSPTRRQASYISMFYLYLNLTKPQQRLFVSYSRTDSMGKKIRPSYLIGVLHKIFPNLKENCEQTSQDVYDRVIGMDGGKNYLISGFRRYRQGEQDEIWDNLFRLYRKESVRRLEQLTDAAFYQSPQQMLTIKNAQKLYGTTLEGSISRLERYAQCAFSHFLTYGLRLEERKEFKVSMPDIGNVFHAALELFSTTLKEKGITWRKLDEEQRVQIGNESVAAAVKEYGGRVLESSSRMHYLVERVNKVMQRTILTMQEQIKRGQFEPESFERAFSYSNQYMNMNGRIDRIDTCEKDGTVFVKVVDYKTGNTSLDVNLLYYGLQLQLGTYLQAAMQAISEEHPDSKVLPAGIFYYHLTDPIVDKSDHVEQDIRTCLRPDGLVNINHGVVGLMDESLTAKNGGLKPSMVSDVIPVDTKADGTVSTRSGVADDDKFHGLLSHLDETMEQYGKEILEGNAQINPYLYGTHTPCSFCSYGAICGFDSLNGKNERELRKGSAEELWQVIGQKNKNK